MKKLTTKKLQELENLTIKKEEAKKVKGGIGTDDWIVE